MFETGLGVSTYFVYARTPNLKLIPREKSRWTSKYLRIRLSSGPGLIEWLKSKAKLTFIPGGQRIDDINTKAWAKPALKKILATDVIQKVPNVWWIRLLALQALAFVVLFTVAEQVALSGGWRLPWETVTWNGLPSMPGWAYDLIFARSNNQPNGSHLLSYLGIPILGLYTIWKTKDLFMGLLIGAFYVAIHESIWEAVYYLFYSQYLGWAEITNVLKDVSFASMIILFIVAFWKYPMRTISMKLFIPVVVIYGGMVALWAVVPEFFGYGFFPITTINNYQYGHGVYSETIFWTNPTINLIESFSWFALFLMMLCVVMMWRPREKP